MYIVHFPEGQTESVCLNFTFSPCRDPHQRAARLRDAGMFPHSPSPSPPPSPPPPASSTTKKPPEPQDEPMDTDTTATAATDKPTPAQNATNGETASSAPAAGGESATSSTEPMEQEVKTCFIPVQYRYMCMYFQPHQWLSEYITIQKMTICNHVHMQICTQYCDVRFCLYSQQRRSHQNQTLTMRKVFISLAFPNVPPPQN